MTDDSQTPTRNFIRGGQVLLHNYRMLKQLFDRILVLIFIVFLTVTVVVIKYRINRFHIFAVKHWSVAHVATFFNKNAKQKMVFPRGYGYGAGVKVVPSALVLRDYRVNYAIKEVLRIIVSSMFYGIFGSLISLALVYTYLRRRGKKQSEEKKLRGYEIATAKDIKKLINKTIASDIRIGDIPMPKDFETGHILIHGTTGMGKTVCIKELLDQIRTRGDRAIIYDQGGDYIYSFYNKDDIILNPLDERTASWDLWQECRLPADYDSLAAALIPTSGHSDSFWSDSSRLAFSAAAKELRVEDKCSMHELLQILLYNDLVAMEKFFRGTEASSIFSQKIDRTSLSIKATLATYLKSLEYIKEDKNPFSIKSWVQDDRESNNNWLFISSRADSHETLKPLISMWLDLAINSLLSLTPSRTRKIWLIFDELASLHRLPYLPSAFAQSRKFGGCIVAGIQSISQLRKVYGHDASNEISTMCNTRIFFRAPSSEAALWTSKEIGQYEVEEMKEGISYSESAMRSGISIAKQRTHQDLVSPAEIMSLNALEAYMRLPGRLPITKIKLKYKKRKTENQAFVQRVIAEKERDDSGRDSDKNSSNNKKNKNGGSNKNATKNNTKNSKEDNEKNNSKNDSKNNDSKGAVDQNQKSMLLNDIETDKSIKISKKRRKKRKKWKKQKQRSDLERDEERGR